MRIRLRDLAGSRVRYGYRRLTVLLRREGWKVNTKRVYRLYREEGLQIQRVKRVKRAALLGLRLAQASGKHIGRPKRVFRRDELVRLRERGDSWRCIAARLGIPVMTAVDAYWECTETVVENGTKQRRKTKRKPASV